jgi:hypothetical protein
MRIVATGAGFRRGIRATLPLTVGLIPFGLVVGVLAQAQGLSALEQALMSALVFAGSSQVVALKLWRDPARRQRCLPGWPRSGRCGGSVERAWRSRDRTIVVTLRKAYVVDSIFVRHRRYNLPVPFSISSIALVFLSIHSPSGNQILRAFAPG